MLLSTRKYLESCYYLMMGYGSALVSIGPRFVWSYRRSGIKGRPQQPRYFIAIIWSARNVICHLCPVFTYVFTFFYILIISSFFKSNLSGRLYWSVQLQSRKRVPPPIVEMLSILTRQFLSARCDTEPRPALKYSRTLKVPLVSVISHCLIINTDR